MAAVSFTVNANAFKKCAPAISTNIKQCGSVTQCNAKAITGEELSTAYMRSNEFRVMEALFHHDMEIKMCEAVQNGLYDFLMANKVSVNNRMTTRRLNSGLLEIAPFVMARQYSPINNEFWLVAGGHVSGNSWVVSVHSSTNIPADVRGFPVGQRVFIEGKSAGGSATKTAWVITAVALAADGLSVTLTLTSQNTASNMSPDKLGSPINGLLRRGTPNVSDYEKWCAEAPAYLNWKNVPFWVESTRNSLCKSQLYDKWRKLVMEDNALYREFFDLDEIEKNKQIAADWQKRMVNAMFYNKALPFQNAMEYDNLDEIPAYDGTLSGQTVNSAGGISQLGVEGGSCVGRRANAVGVIEQLAECGRVYDAQGAQLNLPALFVSLYNIMRVREGRQHPDPRKFDIFTDTVTAELINQAMLKYYNAKSDNMLRLNMPVDGFSVAKKAEFGFYYRSYPLFWPQGVWINIITHNYFDDYLTAAAAAGQEDTARVLWILDFTGIYPGILASNRVVNKTGDLKALAAINPEFACVMKVNSVEQTLTSVTWTMIVECPNANLIIENFAATIPEHATLTGAYPSNPTSTTTTTPTEYWNTAQTYTTTNADCPGGTGTAAAQVTVTVAANTYASSVSQNDANAQALAAATAEAKAKLECT